MEQRYHFIKNATKLLGITLVVYIFMKWILALVLPFFVAFYLAGKLKKAKERKRKHPSFRLFIGLGITGLVGVLSWYLYKEFTDLWSRRGELLRWEGAENSGVFGKLYMKLLQRFETDRLMNQLIENITSPVEGMGKTLGGFITIAFVLVATVLMYQQYDILKKEIEGNIFGKLVMALGKDLSVAGGDYLKAQGWILLIVTVVCIIALLIVGNDYAVLAGIVIGLCDALPFIGTALVFVPWSIIMFFRGKVFLGIYYLFLAGATSLLRQFLEPKLIGQRVGANPLAVLISIYLGIEIYGIWGVVLGPASAFLIWEIYRFA